MNDIRDYIKGLADMDKSEIEGLDSTTQTISPETENADTQAQDASTQPIQSHAPPLWKKVLSSLRSIFTRHTNRVSASDGGDAMILGCLTINGSVK